jgi:hypothetical protein
MKRCVDGWFDNLEKEDAADYRLPTFGPHGTNLGHSSFQ